MSNLIQRAYPRKAFEAPVQYAPFNSGDTESFQCTRILNYSAGGMCYETDQELAPDEEVCIIMDNYRPGVQGPEGYRSYLTQIRWMQPLPKTASNERFLAGARIIARSHEVLTINGKEPRQSCDLCGALMKVSQLQCSLSNVQLCMQCLKHYQSIPQGKIRESVERFLMGNVV